MKKHQTRGGRKVRIGFNVSETTAGMGASIPTHAREFKGRCKDVGCDILDWLITNGYLSYGNLIDFALFKDLTKFRNAGGDKELVIKLVGKDKNGRQE